MCVCSLKNFKKHTCFIFWRGNTYTWIWNPNNIKRCTVKGFVTTFVPIGLIPTWHVPTPCPRAPPLQTTFMASLCMLPEFLYANSGKYSCMFSSFFFFTQKIISYILLFEFCFSCLKMILKIFPHHSSCQRHSITLYGERDLYWWMCFLTFFWYCIWCCKK